MKKLFLGLLLFSNYAYAMNPTIPYIDIDSLAAEAAALDAAEADAKQKAIKKLTDEFKALPPLPDLLNHGAAAALAPVPIATKNMDKMRQLHEQSNFSCPHCEKTFKTRNALNGHLRTHNKIKSNTKRPTPLKVTDGFKCPFCDYVSNRSHSTVVHIRTHTGERPYKCTFKGCAFAGRVKGQLNSHIRTHTGEKPYKCTFKGCTFAGTQRSNLTDHMRTHTGERPYKCTFKGCTFAGTQRSNLTDHMRTHTGERPFKCPQCGDRFTQSSSQKKHIQREHSKTLGGSS